MEETPQATPSAPEPGSTSQPNARGKLTASQQMEAIQDLLQPKRENADAEPHLPNEPQGNDDAGTGDSGGDADPGQERGPEGQDAGENDGTAEGSAERRDDSQGERESQEDPPIQSLTVKEISEKLGIEPDALYKALNVTTGDGETATLEELKNGFAERHSEARGTAQKAAELDRREAGLASDIQALGVLDAMQSLQPQVRQQAAQHLNTMAEREWHKFTALVPEMQDDGTRLQFDKDVASLLQPYGLTPEHFGVRTAGMLRLIRDVVKDRKTLKKLTAPKPKPAPEAVKRNRVPQKPKPAPLTGQSKRQQEVGQIARLLGE